MEYVRTFTREFDTGDRVRLSVDARSGTVSVRGEDVQRVRIDVVARIWADDDLEADEQQDLIARGIRFEDGAVTVRAPTLLRPHPLLFFGRGPRIDYQISTPRRTRAEIASRSGRVAVDRLAEKLAITSRSGGVSVADLEGDLRVDARSGTVQAEGVRGAVDIESRSGGTRLGGCTGDVTVRSRSGSVQIEEAGANVKVDARSGSVRYEGDVRGSFDIEVQSGSIRLAVDPDASFFLDAESAHGSVRSDLPLRHGRREPGGDAPTVRLRTRAGAISIGAK